MSRNVSNVVTTTKQKQLVNGVMRKYETIVVLDPSLEESAVKEETNRIQGILKTNGAEDISVEPWGKKEIAYEVRKTKYGTFVCFKYSTPQYDLVEKLTELLRISDRVLKFQSHKIVERARKFKGNPKRVGASEGGDEFSDVLEADY